MPPARLLVSLLVIFACSSVAVAVAVAAAAPSTAPVWTVAFSVKTIPHTQKVRESREIVTPFGTVDISNNPDRSEAHVRATAIGASHVATAKIGIFYLGYSQWSIPGRDLMDMKHARAYLVGDTLVVPLVGISGGSDCGSSYMYFVFLHKGASPVLSKAYGPACGARAFMSVASDGALTLTTWALRWPKVRTYRYTHDAFVLASTQTPKTPAGYSPLITPTEPLTPKLKRATLTVSVPQQPTALYGRLYVNGVRQPLPSTGFDGLAQKVFAWGDAKAVVLQITPDMADGSRLQILRIGKTHLRFSRLFGVKGKTYPEVFYKQDGTKLDFDFVGYDWPCPENHKDCAEGDQHDGPFRLYPITYQSGSSLHQSGSISQPGRGEAVTKNDGDMNGDFPLPALIRRAYHNPPHRWFLLTTTDRCVPADPRTPAALIRQDRTQSDLQDDVVVFKRKNGVPVGVKVGEPESGNMETVYTFFRTNAACQSYASAQNQTLKSLR